jgi:membrane protease subunit HflC
MRLNLVGGIVAVLIIVALVVAYGTLFTVYQTRQALVVRLGQPVRVVVDPGLNYKIPLIDSVINIDKRILDLENPAQEVIASDQKRLVVDAFARYRIKDVLKFYQTVGTVEGANSQLSILLNSALRRVLGEATLTQVVRRRPAGAEQPGGLPAHADRASAGGRAVPRRGCPTGAGDPRQGGSRCHGVDRGGAVQGRTDSRRGRCRAQSHFRRCLRTRS